MNARICTAAAAFGFLTIGTAQASERTALQLHADFFDVDVDGFVEWTETYTRCRALGFSTVTSSGLASAINLALGSTTGGSTWTINLDNIEAGIHGSDTGIYDADGDFVPSAFEAIFSRYDADGDDAISDTEIDALYSGQFTDLTGSLASKAEFGLLFDIAGEEREVELPCSWFCDTYTDTEVVLTRATMTAFYDGSLFYTVAGLPVPE
ncbi:MAG: peroxygenase [Myxococcota bacterium]|jgi:peroxygenase